MRGPVLLCGAIAAGFCASPPAAGQGIACGTSREPMQQFELMFGRNIGGRLGVGEAAWSRFLAREVTPRFPDGFSVVNATGQWRDKERGRLVRERSRLVLIVTADETSASDKIASIVDAYKRQFHQRSVGVISRPVCAAF